MNRCSRNCVLLIVSLVSAAFFSFTNAATYTWKNPAATTNWTDAANWTMTTGPAGACGAYPCQTTDTARFSAGSSPVVLNAPVTIANINITTGYTGNFDFNNQTLTISPRTAINLNLGGAGQFLNVSGATIIIKTNASPLNLVPANGKQLPDIELNTATSTNRTINLATNPLTCGIITVKNNGRRVITFQTNGLAVTCTGIIIDGGTFYNGTSTPSATTLTINGDVVFTANGGIFSASSGNTYVRGNWFKNSGNPVFDNNNGTIIFDGTGSYSIDAFDITANERFYNVTFNNAAGTWALTNVMQITNILTMTAGALNLGNSQQLTLTGTAVAHQFTGGTLDFGTNSKMSIYTGTSTVFGSGITVTGDVTDTLAFTTNASTTFNPGSNATNAKDFPTVQVANRSTITLLGNNLNTVGVLLLTSTGGFNISTNALSLICNGITLTSTTSGTLTATNGTIDCNGNVTQAAGTITPPTTKSFTVSGNWTRTAGTFTNTSGTVTLDSTLSQTINTATAFYNLTCNKTSGSATNSSALTVNGTFTNTAGTFNVGTGNMSTAILSISGGTVALGTTHRLTVTGTSISFTGGTLDYGTANSCLVFSNGTSPTYSFGTTAFIHDASDTIVFQHTAGTILITPGTQDYPNLCVRGTGGTVQLNANLVNCSRKLIVRAGTFKTGAYSLTTTGMEILGGVCDASTALGSINNNGYVNIAGGTLTPPTTGTFTVAGNWTQTTGTFTNTTGTVTLDSNLAQTINTATAFYNLRVFKSGGSATNSAAVTVNSTYTNGAGTYNVGTGNMSVGNLSIGGGMLALGATHRVTVTGPTVSFSGGTLSFGTANSCLVFTNTGSPTYTFTGTTNFTHDATDSIVFANTAGTISLIPGTQDYPNICVRSTGTVQLSGNLTYSSRKFIMRSGTFKTNAYSLTTTGLEILGGTLDASTALGSLNNNGYVNIAGGTLTPPTTGSFTVAGNWTYSSGTFTNTAGTITLDSNLVQTINSSVAFYNLTTSKTGGSATHGSALTVNGTYTNSAGTFTVGTGEMSTAGLSVSGGTLSLGTYHRLTVSGTSVSLNGGTIDFGTTSKLQFTSTASPTINLGTTAFTYTTSDTIAFTSASGIFSLIPGTANFPTMQIATGGTLRLAGNMTTGSGLIAMQSGTFDLGTNDKIAAGTELLQTGGTIDASANGSIDIAGDVTLSGGTLKAPKAVRSFTVGGSWDRTAGATFTNDGGTMTFDGATTGNTISTTTPNDFAGLTINGTGDWITNTPIKVITLTLTTGTLRIPAATTDTVTTTLSINGGSFEFQSDGSLALQMGTCDFHLLSSITTSTAAQIVFISNSTTQIITPATFTLPIINHVGTATLQIATGYNLLCNGITLADGSGTFNVNGRNININNNGNFLVTNGKSTTFSNLGGSTITITGNGSFFGTSSSTKLSMNPSVDFTIVCSKSLEAYYTTLSHAKLTGGNDGYAYLCTGNADATNDSRWHWYDAIVWKGTSTSMKDKNNWVGTNLPQQSDVILFGPNNKPATLDSSFSVAGIVFQSSYTSTFNFGNTTKTLTITGSTADFSMNGTISNTDGNIVFAGGTSAQQLTPAPTQTLPPITIANSATGSLTIVTRGLIASNITLTSGIFNLGSTALPHQANNFTGNGGTINFGSSGTKLKIMNATANFSGCAVVADPLDTLAFNFAGASTFTPKSSELYPVIKQNSTTGTTTLAGNLNAGNLVIVAGTLSTATYSTTVTGIVFPSGSTGTLNTSNGSIDCNGTVAISGGTLTPPSAGSFTVSGNWTQTAGTFTNTAGSVIFDGTAAQTISATGSFYDIVNNKASGTLSNPGSLTINNNFTNTLGSFTTAATMNVAKVFAMTAGIFTIGNGKTLNLTSVSDAHQFTSGTINFGTNARITVSSTAPLTMNGVTVTADQTDTLALLMNGGGTTTFTPGTNNYPTLQINCGTGTTTVVLGADYTTAIGAAMLVQQGTLDLFTNDKKITCSKLIQSGGTISAISNGSLDVNGDVTLSSGTFIAPMAGKAFTVSGSWSHSAGNTFTHNNGIVTFDGTSTTGTITTGVSNIFGSIAITGTGTWESVNSLKCDAFSISSGSLQIPDGITDSVTSTLSITGGVMEFQGTGTLALATPAADFHLISSVITSLTAQIHFYSNAVAQTLTPSTATLPIIRHSGSQQLKLASGYVLKCNGLTNTNGQLHFNSQSVQIVNSGNLTVSNGTSGTITGLENSTITVAGNTTVSGNSFADRLVLTSTANYTLTCTGDVYGYYIDIDHCQLTNGSDGYAFGSHNNGNNDPRWHFYSGVVWQGTSTSSWNTASNWAGGVLPQTTDTVIFGPFNNPCVLDADATVGGIVFQNDFDGLFNFGNTSKTITITGRIADFSMSPAASVSNTNGTLKFQSSGTAQIFIPPPNQTMPLIVIANGTNSVTITTNKLMGTDLTLTSGTLNLGSTGLQNVIANFNGNGGTLNFGTNSTKLTITGTTANFSTPTIISDQTDTLEFTKAGAVTFTYKSSETYPCIKVDNTSATVSFGANITANGLIVNAGSVSLASSAVTATVGNVDGNGTINLTNGRLKVMGTTFDGGNLNVVFSGTDTLEFARTTGTTQFIPKPSSTYLSVKQNGAGGITSVSAATTITNLTVSAGTFTSPTNILITVGGLLRVNGGTLTLGEDLTTADLTLSSGTCALGNTNIFTVSGTPTFSGGTLDFGNTSQMRLTKSTASWVCNFGATAIVANATDILVINQSVSNRTTTLTPNAQTFPSIEINSVGSVTLGGNLGSCIGKLIMTAGTFSTSTYSMSVSAGMDLNGGTFNASSGSIVAGDDVKLAGCAFTAPGAGSFTCAGDWIVTGGTFATSNGTVTFNGSGDQTIDAEGTPFYSLIINKPSGIVGINSLLTVSNTFTNTAGYTQVNTGPVSFANYILTNGTFDLNNNNQVSISGTGTFNGGTLELGTSSKLSLTSTSSPTYNLNTTTLITDPSDTLAFTAASGTPVFTPNGSNLPNVLIATGGTVRLGANMPSGSGKLLMQSGTFDLFTNDKIAAGSELIQTGGIIDALTNGSIDINGNVSLTGGTLRAPKPLRTFTVSGSFSKTAGNTFTSNSGTVTFDGSVDGNTIVVAPSNSFYNVALTGSGGWSATAPIKVTGLTLQSATLHIPDVITDTVTTTLTINSGTLDIAGSGMLALAGTAADFHLITAITTSTSGQIDFIGTTADQVLTPALVTMPIIKHSGTKKLQIAAGTTLLCNGILQNGTGTFDFNSRNVTVDNNGSFSVVNGTSTTFAGLGGNTITINGDGSFFGTSVANRLNMTAGVDYTIVCSGSLIANYADISHSKLTGGVDGTACASRNSGNNDVRWHFLNGIVWKGTTTSWNTATNWIGSALPQVTDTVLFGPYNKPCLLDANVTVGGLLFLSAYTSTFDFGNSTRTLTVTGRLTDLRMGATGTLANTNGTLKFQSVGTAQTFIPGTQTLPPVVIDNTTGSLTVTTNPLQASSVTMTTGTLNLGVDGLNHQVSAFSGNGGTLNFGSNATKLSITGSSADFSSCALVQDATDTLDFSGSVAVMVKPRAGQSFPFVKHSGSGTLQLSTNDLAATGFKQVSTAGSLDFAGKGISTSGDLTIDVSGSANLSNLGGGTFTVGGDAVFNGTAADSINLQGTTPWYINVALGKTLTANYAILKNSYATGVDGLALLTRNAGRNDHWRFTTNSEPSYQWARHDLTNVIGGAVSYGKIFISGGDTLYAINSSGVNKGQTAWKYSSGNGVCTKPSYTYSNGDERIVVGQGTHCIRYDDAEGFKWDKDLGATPGTPYVSPDDNSVYALLSNNKLTKRSFATGNRDGTFGAGNDITVANASIAADMVIFNGWVLTASTNGVVTRFDAGDGSVHSVYNTGSNASINQPLLVESNVLYIAASNDKLYTRNATNLNTQAWNAGLQLGGANTGAPSFNLVKPQVYVAATSRLQRVTNKGTYGEIDWTFDAGGTIRSSPLAINGYVYFGRDNGTYYCINDTTRAVPSTWPFQSASGNATSGPWIDYSTLPPQVIFGTDMGDLHSFSCK